MSETLNRRDFLVYGGATIAGVTLGEFGRRYLARADARAGQWHATPVESWATSVCRECPAGCGVHVRLMDRVPVKLEGNPRCPIANGRLCAKGQAALESYFDPDRLLGPVRRTARGAAGQWKRISWDEAIGLLASHLSNTAQADGAVVALAAAERGPLADAWARFWSAQHARVGWTAQSTAENLAPGFTALTGAEGAPVFDLARASYVLSFGAPVVEDWLSPVWSQRSYGRFRRGAARSRGRLVQVDSRRSLTSRKADEWLPVAPERQAMLANGLAAILLREDRVDRRALADWGGGFAEVERALVAEYIPDSVAIATGVPVVTLLRLARDLVSTDRPLVVVDADADADLVRAVFVLNALIGALDRPGGVLEATVPAQTQAAAASATRVLREMADGALHPRVVALRDASALRALAAPRDLTAVFGKSELVVSFSPYLDETAAVADLILPMHTSLESWHALEPSPVDGRSTLACARPAAEARLETRDLVAILGATAAKAGGELAAACPWTDSQALVMERLDAVWKLRRGTPYAEPFETAWTEQLERGGWWVPPAGGAREFAAAALDAGGWVDPYFEPGQLRQTVAARGGLQWPAFVKPSLAPANGTSREFPLRAVIFTPAVANLVGGPNQPVLYELLGQPDGPPWQVWAEISADTARLYHIEHGANVRIASASGSIDVAALVNERSLPGTVAISYVPAIPRAGRWASLVSSDVRRLWPGAQPDGPVFVRVSHT